jgi:glycosyltransferase involved in cell wall biosynthesis
VGGGGVEGGSEGQRRNPLPMTFDGPTLVIPTTTDWGVEHEGGTETFLRNLAREGSRRGMPIQILSTGTGPLKNGSVEVRPIMPTARNELVFVRALRRQLRSRTLPLPAGAVVLANAEHYVWPFMRSTEPVLLVAHGAVPPTLRSTRGRLKTLAFETLLEGRAIARASRIAVVSEGTGAYYRTKFPSAAHKVLQIPIGIDLDAVPQPGTPPGPDRWHLGPDRPKVLFAGRLSKEKGLPLLIEACGQLRAAGTPLQLIVAGDGPLRGWIQARSGANPWLRAVGRIHHADLMELILHSELVAIASAYEGLPTILLEALAAGVPVVSTDVGRAGELVAPSNGVVVGPSPGEFADGISRALRLDRRPANEEARRLRPLLSFRRTADRVFELAKAIATEELPWASSR